jgi:hypothetical protein
MPAVNALRFSMSLAASPQPRIGVVGNAGIDLPVWQE